MSESEKRQDMLEQLGELTRKMDVPDYRRTDYRWLAKNLAARNSAKTGFDKAMTIIQELVRMG
jgi:hypothetical protein